MASLVYKITGKHDDKGIKDAEKSLEALKTEAKEVQTAFNRFNDTFNKVNESIQGFIGVKIFKKVLDTIGACNEAYLEFSKKTNSVEASFQKYNSQLKEMEGLTNAVKVNIGKMFSGISSSILDWVIPKLEEIAAWVERRAQGTMSEDEVRKKYKTMEVTYNRAKENMMMEVSNSPYIQEKRAQGMPQHIIDELIKTQVREELIASAKDLEDGEMKQLFTVGYENFIKSIIDGMAS
jgi:hypothetical protein